MQPEESSRELVSAVYPPGLSVFLEGKGEEPASSANTAVAFQPWSLGGDDSPTTTLTSARSRDRLFILSLWREYERLGGGGARLGFITERLRTKLPSSTLLLRVFPLVDTVVLDALLTDDWLPTWLSLEDPPPSP